MGKAVEVITGFATAPGANLTNLTMAAGNTLQIRNTNDVSPIRLLKIWAKNQTAGIVVVRSPRLHDNVQNLRFRNITGSPLALLANKNPQILVSQDTLIAQISGSATAGDIEQMSMLIQYDSLPGVEGRFITTDELKARTVNIMTVETSHLTVAGGGYTGQVAINSSFDLMKANTDYALIGYEVNLAACTIRWQGADLGNLGIGGPAINDNRQQTRNYFVDMSDDLALPLIPVFNSANKNGILVDIAADENVITVLATSIFAELKAA